VITVRLRGVERRQMAALSGRWCQQWAV